LKLICTHQILVYADDVNLLGGSVHSIEKNKQSLVVASKETALEIKLIKLSTWSCIEIGMRDEVTVRRSIIVPLNG